MTISSTVEIEAWRYTFSDLPAAVAATFNSEERAAYCEGSGAILRALRATGEHSAIRASSLFRDDYPFRVYIEDFLCNPTLWFGISSLKLKHQLRVCLPRSSDQFDWAPSRLRQVLSSVGGLASGLPYSPRLFDSRKASDHYNGRVVIAYANGDRLVVVDENVSHYYEHESQRFIPVLLDDYLDEFFNELFAFDELFTIKDR